MAALDLAVVGSGVVGLTAAWRLASTGQRVVVVDAHPGRGASYAAAGMIAPVTEAAFGEEAVTAIALRAADGWPAFAAALEQASGFSVGLEQRGTLLVAADRSDRAQLEQLLEYHRELGLDSRWCRASECRSLEPLLDPAISGGLFAAGDRQVDNRRLLAALATAAAGAGATFLTDEVVSLIEDEGGVCGVRTRGGRELAAARTLLASGAALTPFAPADLPQPRPVKGQILRLRTPAAGPWLSRTVRAVVRGQSVYVVPRGDGRVVVGATVEEHGDPRRVTVGGVYELLRDAVQVLPALKEFELLESFAAARPGSPDNAPLVGATSIPGLYLATGHYRHGILLAPVTAAVLEAVLSGTAPPAWSTPLDPARFAPALR
ncbi:MAG TPA: glycine oxidase ThiO [Acidimicrobiales bacterium]|nr:glycine oxidase ThiO [Acidimicrobiales bacterium]